MDQIATAFEGACAAEWVRERGIGCEVGIDRFGLGRKDASQQGLYSIIMVGVLPVQQASPGRACVRRR